MTYTWFRCFLLTFTFSGFHRGPEESVLQKIMLHMSYIDLWASTLEGKITPRFLLFPLSMTAVHPLVFSLCSATQCVPLLSSLTLEIYVCVYVRVYI